jgi:hypothetical protein
MTTLYFLASPYHCQQLPPCLVKLHLITGNGNTSNHIKVFFSDVDTLLKAEVSTAIAVYFFVPQGASFNTKVFIT